MKDDAKMQVTKFGIFYERLTPQNKNKEAQKILIECEYLKRLFICKWGKTTSKGTKATFKLADEATALKRCEELKILAEKWNKKYRE